MLSKKLLKEIKKLPKAAKNSKKLPKYMWLTGTLRRPSFYLQLLFCLQQYVVTLYRWQETGDNKESCSRKVHYLPKNYKKGIMLIIS